MSTNHPHPRPGQLDATSGREVVFCHACSAEWWKTEGGLTCPNCGSEATEIVSPENDPRRHDDNASEGASPEIPPYRYRGGEDSDPEEADIDDHFAGPHRPDYLNSPRPAHQRLPNPAIDPIFERFFDMVQGFGPRQGGEEPGVPPLHRQRLPAHQHFGPHYTRTTIRSGPGGGRTTASFTIFSGSMGEMHGPPGDAGQPDIFQDMLNNAIRDIGPGAREEPLQEGVEGPPRPPNPGLARSLREILLMLSPPDAVMGDAVYSQEALDRIVTGLMEANPHSNAAPPATEEALNNITRKTVDREMLAKEEHTECAICIDDLEEGQTAAFLPCKHRFHEACVVLWLKEHNTCPVCRSPVEKNDSRANNNNNNNSGGSNQNNPRSPPVVIPMASGGLASLFNSYESRPPSGRNQPGPQDRSDFYHRPPSQSQTPINEAMRSILTDQERRRDARERSGRSAFTSEASRQQRRNSHSPTSPPVVPPGHQGARMRERSPSESSRRYAEEGEGRRGPGGPFNWIRDRFGGSGSHRDDRRS